jgi:hypothetical protein
MMQLRCRSRIIFSAAVLCLGAGKLAAQSSAQRQDSLSEARKDLEELPATARTPDGSGAKAINTGKLDLVIPSNGSAPPTTPSAVQNAEAASSQGWLFDALNKDKTSSALTRDTRESGRAGANAGTRARAGAEARQGNVDTTGAAETARAWTPLLQAWLLPQNRTLIPTLFGSDATSRGPKEEGSFSSRQGVSGRAAANANLAIRSPSSATPAERLTGDATYHDPLAQQPNPYLENANSAAPSPTEFHMPRLTAPVSTSRAAESANQSEESLYPVTGDNKAGSHRQDEIPAPTTPVVNQQKYFPQLDRF